MSIDSAMGVYKLMLVLHAFVAGGCVASHFRLLVSFNVIKKNMELAHREAWYMTICSMLLFCEAFGVVLIVLFLDNTKVGVDVPEILMRAVCRAFAAAGMAVWLGKRLGLLNGYH